MTYGGHLEDQKKFQRLSGMVTVYNTGQMELIMKVNGSITKQKDKEFSGMPKGIFTTVNFKMTWQMAMENILILMVANISENSKMMSKKDTVKKNGSMVPSTLATIKEA